MFRSHGFVREGSEDTINHFKEKYPEVHPLFTFGVPGYNVRSTELNAVLGLEQIQRLDYNIEKRQENFRLWVSLLNDDKYYTDYLEKGSSNFALPLIIKDGNEILLEKVCTLLNNEEYRLGMAGGGNQIPQPI